MENKNHILYDKSGKPSKEPAWIFRTYAGHTNARESNELFRKNLSKGQTGLSIAFDLATQCGYSSDHPIAKPEIGKVGVRSILWKILESYLIRSLSKK
ncbi:Methylmalonyl-CoA mutase [Leptospira interrogans serovar Canicola]|nr:Methylmalonyl-CoA mutase [Leptospira interrogans serovar Canicola]OCC29198.1 Methylmalonyl-CoA mutase [Leptospira interrogans serovar Canicola]OCC29848.1 Methylmalonyl-CoA mutase [Leptospira interrogans serovar Canicola]